MPRAFKRAARLIGALRSIGSMRYMVDSYSQEGEDMILRRLFSGRTEGFYVDVGAHHPFRFSNTYHFYVRGWRGINIEPNPAALDELVRHRRRDINVGLGVAEKPGYLTYHSFDEPALNTFDESLAATRQKAPGCHKYGETLVPVEPLASILERLLPLRTAIDFINIDVEGFDLHVLKSNDWKRFRPVYVLVEALRASLDGILANPIHAYMRDNDYLLIAKTFNTLIYEDLRRQHA